MTKQLATCKALKCRRSALRSDNGRAGYCSLHYQRLKRHGTETTPGQKKPAVDWMLSHVSHTGDKCLRWPFYIAKDGYGKAHEFGTSKLINASRLMCRLAHGEPPTRKHEAAHSCGNGNKACVNPKHLYWATATENHHDKVAHGTTNRGSRQGRSRLTSTDIRSIRKLSCTQSQAEIAVQFGIDPSHVCKIINRKSWSWLE